MLAAPSSVSTSTTPPAPRGANDQMVVRINGRADLADVARMPRGAQRRMAAYESMHATATATQHAALAALKPLQAAGTVTHVESMFLPNALVVSTAGPDAQQAVRDALTGVSNVGEIRRDVRFAIPSGTPGDAAATAITTPPNSWAIDAIHAPDAWARGARGAGVTIGFVDSGANVAHPALRDAYRGRASDGSSSHDYNWFDGIDHTPTPHDPGGHGTQVASVALAPKIGVAPDARFIAARATDRGYNSTVATLASLQWMLAPTRADGTAPRPDLGADIVNSSWGTSNGRDEFFRETYDGLRAAGIEVTTATGNSGNVAGNVSAPASYPGFVSVGATDRTGEVADFSSRGPSPLADGSAAPTPLLTAPGLMTPAAKIPDRYVYASGTSIAAPIVAGSLAVLMSAVPDASNEQLIAALTDTATDIASPGIDDASGHGRIDLARALDHLTESRD